MKIEAVKNRYDGDKGWESDHELFAKVAVTWKQWIGQSGEHLYAAQILLPNVQQHHAAVNRLMDSKHRGTVVINPSLAGIYFLHCAFCIENAFKCVIAATSAAAIESEIRKTKRLPKLLLGHDLVELATKAAYDMGTDDEYALTFLTRYGTWAGRYPLPVHNDDNAVTGMLSNGGHYMMGGYNPVHVPAFVAFAASVYGWARARAR